MRPLLVACGAYLAGCHALFGLSTVELPPDADGVVIDTREDDCLEQSFDVGVDPPFETFTTGGAAVAVDGEGRLEMQIPTTTQGMAQYAGIYLANRNHIGMSTEAELVTVTTGPAEVAVQLTLAVGNHYTIAVSRGLLHAQRYDAALVTGPSLPYDPVTMRFVRLRHLADEQIMLFEARGSNAATWSELYRTASTVPLDNVTAEVYAGSYGLNEATSAVVDNLRTGRCF